MPDPIDDLKLMIAAHMASSDARAKDLSERMATRDNLDSEFRGEMRGAMKALQGTQVEHGGRLTAVEKSSGDAQGMARAAMQSHDSLQIDLRAEICEVKTILKEQNDDVERRERLKKEEREMESMAAKRVAANREFRTKMATIWAPILGLVFTSVVGGYVTYVTTSAHADTSAKIERLTNRISVAPVTEQSFSSTIISTPPKLSPAPSASGTELTK